MEAGRVLDAGEGLPAGLHLAHHGAITGMNAWEQVARIVVVGRPAMNRRDGERLAEVVQGHAVEVVTEEGDEWPKVQDLFQRYGLTYATGSLTSSDTPMRSGVSCSSRLIRDKKSAGRGAPARHRPNGSRSVSRQSVRGLAWHIRISLRPSFKLCRPGACSQPSSTSPAR